MCEIVGARLIDWSEVIVGFTREEQRIMAKALRMYGALWAEEDEKRAIELLLSCQEVWKEAEPFDTKYEQ